MAADSIWTIQDKKEEKFLKRGAAKFDFKKHNKKEIRGLVKKMREIMKKVSGIGLSANQIGLDMRVFVAQPEKKFYAVFNPEIIKESDEKANMEEGCLSVPNLYGPVERPEKVTLIGTDMNNKKLKIKAWGLLARVFQHEVDHLNGMLFIDKCKQIYKVEKTSTQKL